MSYESYIQQMQSLDFVTDRKMAETALKAGLGSLVSVLEDDPAKRLTTKLPKELDFATLRGNQIGAVAMAFDQATASLANQFDLEAARARDLIIRAIHCVKSDLDTAFLDKLFSELPTDWQEVIADA